MREHLLHVNLVALRTQDDAGGLNPHGRRRACGVVNGDVDSGLATVVELNRGVIIHILIGCLEEVKRIGGKVARGHHEMAARVRYRGGNLLHPAARHQELKRLVRNRAAGGAIHHLPRDFASGGEQSSA